MRTYSSLVSLVVKNYAYVFDDLRSCLILALVLADHRQPIECCCHPLSVLPLRIATKCQCLGQLLALKSSRLPMIAHTDRYCCRCRPYSNDSASNVAYCVANCTMVNLTRVLLNYLNYYYSLFDYFHHRQHRRPHWPMNAVALTT